MKKQRALTTEEDLDRESWIMEYEWNEWARKHPYIAYQHLVHHGISSPWEALRTKGYYKSIEEAETGRKLLHLRGVNAFLANFP